jgi:hypothetical protein
MRMTNTPAMYCPVCRTALEVGHKGGLTTFRCPSDHGVAIDLVEAYSHLQKDELEAIWDGARRAPQSTVRSPVTGRPMVQVTFTADDDPTYDNVGADAREMTIEVDVDNHIGWFSLEELRSMPVDHRQQSELVSLSELDASAGNSDTFFASLDAGDYETATPRGGMSSLFGGLARRLR